MVHTGREAPARPERTGTFVEVRSIDYVPLRERHGRPWHQGPFWFTGNFVLVTMVTGFIGPSLGLSLVWSIAAVALGALFGTFFMAFHANQGPRMGLPQMIQSRAQFGVRGAIFPFAAVVFVYVGFNVFDVIVATEGLSLVLPASAWVWYPILIGVSILLAVVGHDLLHLAQRWLAYLQILVFGILTVGSLAILDLGRVAAQGGFAGNAFLVQFAAAAGYQISYAVYVSDYSRYLPRETSAPAVISWTYAGAAGSAVWLMSLGSLFAWTLPNPDPVRSVQQIGNDLFSGFGTFTVLAAVPTLITIMAVNSYGAMLTGLSAVDAFRQLRPTVRVRVIGIVAIGLLYFGVALAIPAAYLGSFNNFVVLMLYFLVPWTAVNLVDFYVVRRGHYAIRDIFDPRGIYGAWSWRGLTAYFVGFAAMIPFFNLTFFVGPITEMLGGADVSFAVGLAVSGLLYLALNRDRDPGQEADAFGRSERMLARGGAARRDVRS